MKRKPLLIVGGIVVLLFLIILALPFFINVNQFKPTLETKLGVAMGRKVGIGDIGLSIISGSVTVKDVSVADDPAFSNSPFLTAKSLDVGVEMMPLIFSRQLNISSFTIQDPEISLQHNANGTWNYSTLGAAGQSKTSAPAAAPAPAAGGGGAAPTPTAPGFSVDKLKIANGKIIVGTVGSKAKPSVYSNVNLEASDLSYTTQFPFKLTATGPGNADLKVEGKAGPINQTDTSLTPLNATVNVQHLDLATTGFIDPASGIAGIVDFDGSLGSDGKQMSSKGTVKANKLKASAAGQPSSVPVTVDYATDYTLKSQAGVLNQGDVHIGNALARLTGNYNTSAEPTKVDMKLNAQGMPLGDLEGFLPAVGVVLPPGSKLQGGTLTANLTITGPVDKPVIVGPVNLSNAKLAGFSLKSKLGALSSFTGLGGGGGGSDTEIQTLSANVRNDPSGSKIDNLNLVVPTIGTVTGAGTVSAAGQLDFKLVAKLAGALGGISQVAGGGGGIASSLMGGGAKGNSSGGGIPFKVQGTTSNPQVIPDIGGAMGNMVKGSIPGVGNAGNPAGAASNALGGLLGKKKKP
ncbi:MAG TPA: AsmA family protein [Candidatus Acidoferrales bacterium]|jgi:AsmA protein|nr:AsmA family protein [Candidatus Acidoferrales bacterium]